MSYSSGRIFRSFWASVCFAGAIALPAVKVVQDKPIGWEFITIVGILVVAGIAMFDLEVLVVVGRVLRRFVPGASKEISGKTYIMSYSDEDRKKVEKLSKKLRNDKKG
jgi:hypothetical protein